MRKVVTIHKVRARDLAEEDVAWLKDGWRHVYEAHKAPGLSEDPTVMALWEDLDSRFVILRIAMDPKVRIVARALGPRAQVLGAPHGQFGVGAEYDDAYVALNGLDLVEAQILGLVVEEQP
jgi:hypothetical protein